ncbi:PREDICTED: spermatogenesis-associated protein 31A6-like [Dipodomys ordii]|uniref:Spermatogenesis-associated protein 31A6-like n=1 Tax=Dipodomys ordii TaxID=10020 RepID=A0A1S3GK71_DIPOR|nr:PREDICTED: spermatogenesis-associated protein 31A6-like [Dipodomys ordii]
MKDQRDGVRSNSLYSSHYSWDHSSHKRDASFSRESPGGQKDSPHSRSGSSVSSRSYSPERNKHYPFYQSQNRRRERSAQSLKTSQDTSTWSSSALPSSKRVPDTPLVIEQPEETVSNTTDWIELFEDAQLDSRSKAIASKMKEIERVYQQDCETFGVVVKMLIAKDPSLEQTIQFALRQNLQDIDVPKASKETRTISRKLASSPEYQSFMRNNVSYLHAIFLDVRMKKLENPVLDWSRKPGLCDVGLHLLYIAKETPRAQLLKSNIAIQMMENLLLSLKSVAIPWLSPELATFAMDMILAIVGGVGLYLLLLLLPCFKENPSSPTPERKNKLTQYSVEKRGQIKCRKKRAALKGRLRTFSQGNLISVSVSKSQATNALGKLDDTRSFQRFLKGDALGEFFNSESSTAHLSARDSEEDTFSSTVSLKASPSPSSGGLQPLASTLSPVHIGSSVSVESHTSQSVSQPPEPSIALGEQSFPCSHFPPPVACTPPRHDSHSGLPPCDIREVPPETTPQSSPTNSSRVPSPIPALNSDLLDFSARVLSKRAKLKSACQEKEHPLDSQGNMMKSLGSAQDTAIPQPLWNTEGKPQQLPDSQELFFPMVLQKCCQLFWGLPFLHSESLVAPVQMSGHPLDLPSVLFNSFLHLVPVQVQANVPPPYFVQQPLLHHLVKSQPFTPTLPWPQPSPEAEIQACTHDTFSTPIQSCPSPPVTSSTIPPVVQQLEHHLEKKHLECHRILPSVVKQSHKIFSQDQATWNQRGSSNHSSEFNSLEMREKLEHHLQERLLQHLCKTTGKIQLPPENFTGADQTDNKHMSLQNSTSIDNCYQNIQKYPVSQGWENSRKDQQYSVSRVVSALDRDAESCSGDFLEANTQSKVESDLMSPGSDSGYFPPTHSNNYLRDTLITHLTTKWEQINRDKVPMYVSHSRGMTDHALAPLENSNSSKNTGREPPLEIRETCKSSSQEVSHIDAATRQLLDVHIKKLWAKHQWGLCLKVLKPINILTMKNVPPVPTSQGASPYMTNHTVKEGACQREALPKEQKIEREKTEGHTIQPSQPHSRPEIPRGTQYNHNCGPLEVSPTRKEGRLLFKTQSCILVGRNWHDDIVPRSEGSSIESVKSQAMGMSLTQENENLCHRVSIQEVFVPPKSEHTEDLSEMDEDEEKQPSNMDFNNLNLRNSELLRTKQTPYSSRISISNHPREQEAGSSSTSESTAFDDILQDCNVNAFLQDGGPEVLIADDMLASQSSLTSSQNLSGSSTSTFYKPRTPESRGGHITKQEPKSSKLQHLWYSKMFQGPDETQSSERPKATTQKAKSAGMRPSQSCKLNSPAQVRKTRTVRKDSIPVSEKAQHPPESQFGNRIKKFFMSIFSIKENSQADSLPNSKSQSSNSKNQDLMTSRTQDVRGPEAQTLKNTIGKILEEEIHHEEGQRKVLWEMGMKIIEFHNAEYSQGKHGFTLSMNALVIMITEEFKQDKSSRKLLSNYPSEQSLVNCSGPQPTWGCRHDGLELAFQYVKENGGMDSEESNPYEYRSLSLELDPLVGGLALKLLQARFGEALCEIAMWGAFYKNARRSYTLLRPPNGNIMDYIKACNDIGTSVYNANLLALAITRLKNLAATTAGSIAVELKTAAPTLLTPDQATSKCLSMRSDNLSSLGDPLTNFILVSVSDRPWLELPLFMLLLMSDILPTLGNISIMLVSRLDSQLHSFMYIFLNHLSFLNHCYTTTTVPPDTVQHG